MYPKLLNCPRVMVYTSYTLYILFYITFAMSISYVIIMLYCFTFINVTLLYVLSYYRKYITYYRDIRTVIIIFLMLHASMAGLRTCNNLTKYHDLLWWICKVKATDRVDFPSSYGGLNAAWLNSIDISQYLDLKDRSWRKYHQRLFFSVKIP